MGTVISGLALWCYSYPKYVYKNLFDREYKDYIKETIGYIFLFILIAVFSYFISGLFVVQSNLLQVIVNIFISILIPNLLILLMFYKTEQFKYFKNLILRRSL